MQELLSSWSGFVGLVQWCCNIPVHLWLPTHACCKSPLSTPMNMEVRSNNTPSTWTKMCPAPLSIPMNMEVYTTDSHQHEFSQVCTTPLHKTNTAQHCWLFITISEQFLLRHFIWRQKHCSDIHSRRFQMVSTTRTCHLPLKGTAKKLQQRYVSYLHLSQFAAFECLCAYVSTADQCSRKNKHSRHITSQVVTPAGPQTNKWRRERMISSTTYNNTIHMGC